jgi:anti-sigma factor ChrR (cupin superfamily)
MKTHAPLYALDLLSPEQAAKFERHLAVCPACSAEVDRLRDAAGRIGLAAPPAAPPPGLRARVLELAKRPPAATPAGPQVWKDWRPSSAEELLVVRGQTGDWETVKEGVQAKRLYVDPSRDAVTMLVRMDPGARYVPHRHAGPEQCYVLEGDLRDGVHVFRAGDFQCAASGSVHGAQWTESGCLLLIVSSLHDELLA